VPPGIPSGAQLASYSKSEFHPPYEIGETPVDTLIIGVSYIDQRCSEFFDAVEQTSRKSRVAQSGLATGAASGLSLMATAKKSALSIAYVAAAVELTKVLLEQYHTEFAFAPHSTQLRAITFKAMAAQRKEFGELVAEGGLDSKIKVIAAVKRYAENCTLAQIREHWDNAVSKAVREPVVADNDGQAPENGGGRSGGGGRAGRSGGGYAKKPTNILGVNKYVVH
jgi:hypothetical protein